MRALFVNVGHGDTTGDLHPRHHVAPMDLAQCAAILEEAGWETDLWDTLLTPGASAAEVEQRLLSAELDLLVVRPLAHTGEMAAAMLRSVVDRKVLRLAMGPSVLHTASDLLEGQPAPAHGVIVGEPEGTFLEILDALGRGELPEGDVAGLQVDAGKPPRPRAFVPDLNRLPMPAQHHLVGKGYRFRYPLDVTAKLSIGYVLSSRGCALGCLFCAPVERETFGTKYRWRDPDAICDEVERIRDLGGNAIYFIDDFFGFSPKRIQALCERLIARGLTLPWAAQVRAHGLDLDLLSLMRRAGCSTLCFGAESGSDRVLEVLHKGVTVAEIRAQAELIRRAGIQSVGYFIVGAPGETDEERAATYDLIRELGPDVVQLHIFNVYPGAPAMEAYPELYVPSGTKFTGPTELDRDSLTLDDERREFYRRYYLSPGYISRALRRRWRPLLFNLGEELSFAWRSTRFFLGGP